MHVHARYEVSVIKPVKRETVHMQWQWWCNNDTQQTVHDWISCLAWMPNEPKEVIAISEHPMHVNSKSAKYEI